MSKDLSVPGNGDASPELAEPTRKQVIDDDTLSSIDSWEAAEQAVAEAGALDESFSDYGTGFTVIDNKDQLVGTPFRIVEWRFNKGDNGEFVSFACVTKDGRKLIVNDGSTGIRDQLVKVSAKRQDRYPEKPDLWRLNLLAENGLRRSDYPYTDQVSGETKQASTYYLA